MSSAANVFMALFSFRGSGSWSVHRVNRTEHGEANGPVSRGWRDACASAYSVVASGCLTLDGARRYLSPAPRLSPIARRRDYNGAPRNGTKRAHPPEV